MFLNKVKDFLIKNVKKRLSNVKLFASNNYIKSVGIILDESYFYDKQKLIDELVLKGIDKNAIQFIVFKDKIKKGNVWLYYL